MRTSLLTTTAMLIAASTMAFAQGTDETQTIPSLPGATSAPPEASAVPEAPQIDPASIGGLIEVQQEGQSLASDLLGADVAAGPEGNAVGEITDLIFDENDKLVGVVISTGGFLGLGERELAVETGQLRHDSEWNLYRIEWSEGELEAAPEFMTLAAQVAQREADALLQRQQQDLQQPAEPVPAQQQ